MKHIYRIGGLASVMMLLSACSSMPSLGPTLPTVAIYPAACLMPCPPLPIPESPNEADLIRWELSVVQWGEVCRSRHNDCSEQLHGRNEYRPETR